MEEKIIIALGGNALQSSKSDATAEAQLEVVKKTCRIIADIVSEGYEIGIVHGNGPQVGRIMLASETASNVTPKMPFDVCGAMSQGYIGYHIQESLENELHKRNINIPVVSLVTTTVVDQNDPAFNNPTKPIGKFYSSEEAEKLHNEKGYVMKEDAGRGWRRVVPSPKPQEIVELQAVKELWPSTIVICTGGGGVPVVCDENGDLKGVEAVIDKDFGGELLAEGVDADIFMILTEVEKVAIHFNKPDQINLDRMTLAEAEKYIEENEFAKGSMLPKVEAAMKFVRKYPDRKAIITSLDKAKDALQGKAGTTITAM